MRSLGLHDRGCKPMWGSDAIDTIGNQAKATNNSTWAITIHSANGSWQHDNFNGRIEDNIHSKRCRLQCQFNPDSICMLAHDSDGSTHILNWVVLAELILKIVSSTWWWWWFYYNRKIVSRKTLRYLTLSYEQNHNSLPPARERGYWRRRAARLDTLSTILSGIRKNATFFYTETRVVKSHVF